LKANVLFKQGKLADALKAHRKAMMIREVVLGGKNIDSASSYFNIGNILQLQGDADAALVEYRKCRKIEESLFGDDSVEVGWSSPLPLPLLYLLPPALSAIGVGGGRCVL